MKRIYLFIIGFCTLCWACGSEPSAGEVAAQTAKAYYDALVQGKYEQFVDGRYRSDSIPESYREQLLANAKMFMGEQQDKHRGISEVRVANAQADTASHSAQVFLILVYGDSTGEEVVVPMLEHRGVWYMK